MKLSFYVNADEIVKDLKEMKEDAKKALEDGVRLAAMQTHQYIADLATQKLTTTRQTYLDNLEFKEIADNVYIVALNKPAMWIEEGMKPHSMVDDLLKNGAHQGKNGRYKAIPFKHNKAPSQMNPFSRNLLAKIKSTMKQHNIPYKALEMDPMTGKPKEGKLHTFNITSPYPSAKASHQALHGLAIYQTKMPGGNVRKDIMTFRTVSDSSKAMGKWFHPGLEEKHFFEKAVEWMEQEWNQNIMPSILAKFGGKS